MDIFARNGFLRISQKYLEQGQGGRMECHGKDVVVFKIKNRSGYAAICCDHLTEGNTSNQALERMEKALRRTGKKQK